MKKKILVLLFLVSIVSHAFSQSSPNNKMFHAIGFSFLTDFSIGPLSWELGNFQPNSNGSKAGVFNPATGQYGTYDTSFYQGFGYSPFTFLYRFRYNVYEPSDNFAVSLGITPSLGLSIGGGGVGHINVPVMATAEFGAGSTYSSTAGVGGLFGIGFEYTKLPLLNINKNATIDSWYEFVVATGIRYWGISNKLREVNIKLGYGSAGPPSSIAIYERAISARLAWIYFLNY